MRTIDSTLQARLNTGTTHLCHIFIITLKNGTIFRFTDLDHEFIYSGDTYRASDSIVMSAITTTANNGTQTTDCNIIFNDTGISELEVIRGQFDSAVIEFSIVDHERLDLPKIILLKGSLASFNVTNKKMGQFQVNGILTRGDMRIGEYYSSHCRADLGDARCKVDLAGLTNTGFVHTVDSRSRLTVQIGGSPSNQYYAWGVISFTSGLNNGISVEVLNQFAVTPPYDQLNLALPMPYPVAVADTFTLTAGCDKTTATCISKFNNIVNNRSEPFVPGSDFIVDSNL